MHTETAERLILRILSVLTLVVFTASLSAQTSSSSAAETIQVDARAQGTSFPHFWEKTFGSGRAILALRDSYRKDLHSVKQITDFEAVRFHGIFDDEVGLYDPDRKPVQFAQMKNAMAAPSDNAGIYNFSYVDQIYDGLLEQGIQPFVELSFMPKKLASDPDSIHPFWYHPNVTPPRDYAQWDAMITAFVQHLEGIARHRHRGRAVLHGECA